MREAGAATENDMIAAFVRAEIDAERYAHHYIEAMQRFGWSRTRLVDAPDVRDFFDNMSRRVLLQYRGYPDNHLFKGLPKDIQWRKAMLEPSDFSRLKYGAFSDLLALSGGSSLVTDGVDGLDKCNDEQLSSRIRAVAADAANGKQFPELILLEGNDGELILFEGATRATAFAVIGQTENVAAYLGTSSRIHEWNYYPGPCANNRRRSEFS